MQKKSKYTDSNSSHDIHRLTVAIQHTHCAAPRSIIGTLKQVQPGELQQETRDD